MAIKINKLINVSGIEKEIKKQNLTINKKTKEELIKKLEEEIKQKILIISTQTKTQGKKRINNIKIKEQKENYEL